MKSDLILSILQKFPIGSITIEQTKNEDSKIDSETYWKIIDGQQRLKTISEFRERNFKMSETATQKLFEEFSEFFEEETNTNDTKEKNKKQKLLEKLKSSQKVFLSFEELPAKLKKRFNDFNINLEILTEWKNGEVRELFRRIQNQEKLKAGEIINSYGGKIKELINPILDIGVFGNEIRFNNKRKSLEKTIVNVIGILERKINLGVTDKKVLQFSSDLKELNQKTKDGLDKITQFLKNCNGVINTKIDTTKLKFLLLYTSKFGDSIEKEGIKDFFEKFEGIFSVIKAFKSKDNRDERIKNDLKHNMKYKDDYEMISNLTSGEHNPKKVFEGIDSLQFLIRKHDMGIEENEENEFKSSLKYDFKTKQSNNSLKEDILKTICGMMNKNGGKIHIGKEDNGNICGIENNLKVVQRKSKDGFKREIQDMLSNNNLSSCIKLIKFDFRVEEGKTYCILNIKKSSKYIYLKEVFYFREDGRTRKLHGKELEDHLKEFPRK